MRQVAALIFLVSLGASAQAYEDNSSPKDAYSKGYKEGFREGYEQARRDLSGSSRPAPPPPAPVAYPITISVAKYGTSRRDCDATRYVARRANGKMTANVDVSNSICGDPAPGDRKSLDITYVCGNRAKTATAFEHRTVYLSCND